MAPSSKAIAAPSVGRALIIGNALAEAAVILPDLTTGGTATAGPGATPANEGPANAFNDNQGSKVLIFTNPTEAAPITLTYDFAGKTASIVRS